MSAWTVSRAHVDCLVQAAATEGLVPLEQATQVGAMLWRENFRSVNYRYGERKRHPRYAFAGVESPLDDGVVYVQVDCYSYQTCEHPGWERSEARRLVEALGDLLLARMGVTAEQFRNTAAYSAAPWGIDDLSQAIARTVAGQGAPS